jgi:Carbohydrate esterase, sialic acid-specific acetylesterase
MGVSVKTGTRAGLFLPPPAGHTCEVDIHAPPVPTSGEPFVPAIHTFRFAIWRGAAHCMLAALCPFAALASPAFADDVPNLPLLHPQPYQVVQRQGFEPLRAHEHEPLGPALGFADVSMQADLTKLPAALADATFEFRAVPLPGAYGPGADWSPVHGTRANAAWTATARIPAGGWYRIELRARRGDETLAAGQVEPVGVGEVFLIAGQSYAVGANDELTHVDDPQGRVVAYDVVERKWRVANDPQPNAGDGGTIWPTLGNHLLPLARVPIGFVNVAVGGTATRQWLPGEKLYEQLAAAGKQIGRFRAVLWQQGESDVIEHRSTDYYVQNMLAIRQGLAKAWGFEPPWLLAKSTLHPTVYNDPAGEGQIRLAIDRLSAMPGFRPGPDTDILGGENRGGIDTRRHFSGIGQRRAGLLWFAAIWHELNRPD